MKSFLKLTRNTVAALALVLAVNALSLRAEIIYWPLTGLDVAKQRAISLNCVSNLKRIALGAREWSAWLSALG